MNTVGSKTYRVTPIDLDGKAGESVLVSFNFISYSRTPIPEPGVPILESYFLSSSAYTLLGRYNNRFSARFYNSVGFLRGVRFRNGTQSILLEIPAAQQNVINSSGFFNTEFNAADLGLNSNQSLTVSATLVAQNGKESQPWRISFNPRLGNAFLPSNHDTRAAETLGSILPIGFTQAFGEGALSVQSLENYQSYSRVRTTLKSQAATNTDQRLILQSVYSGFVQIRDNQGTVYKVELEQTRDGQCGFRRLYNSLDFGLILTPKVPDTVSTLVFTYVRPATVRKECLVQQH